MHKRSSQRIRKAVPGAILALVVAWACAGGVLWQAARIVHYHVMRSGARDERATDTVRLTPASKVVWIEEDELRYEGHMFDVRVRRKAGTDWLLIGHYDHADDEIFELLHALFGLESQSGEGARRCAVFLPEATLLSFVQHQPHSTSSLMLWYNSARAEYWQSRAQGRLEHPPEGALPERS